MEAEKRKKADQEAQAAKVDDDADKQENVDEDDDDIPSEDPEVAAAIKRETEEQ